MLKTITLIVISLALFPVNASARDEKPLVELEAHCWASTVEDGGFLCQYLMLMGKVEGRDGWQVPELYAPEGDEKRQAQAHLACEKLGFRYARRFEVATADKETQMIRLESTAQYVWQGKGAFIRHLLCE